MGQRRGRAPVLFTLVTSMYLLPIWCLCLCRARSLCSSLTKRTRASPFLLPWALRHSAAPPLRNTTQRGCGRCANRHIRRLRAYDADGWATYSAHVLGDVEPSEESSNVLVRRLPRQTPGSDHRVVAHFLHLAAAHANTLVSHDSSGGLRLPQRSCNVFFISRKPH